MKDKAKLRDEQLIDRLILYAIEIGSIRAALIELQAVRFTINRLASRIPAAINLEIIQDQLEIQKKDLLQKVEVYIRKYLLHNENFIWPMGYSPSSSEILDGYIVFHKNEEKDTTDEYILSLVDYVNEKEKIKISKGELRKKSEIDKYLFYLKDASKTKLSAKLKLKVTRLTLLRKLTEIPDIFKEIN
jgi:c-di-AMP phosphodiesterase-like protein